MTKEQRYSESGFTAQINYLLACLAKNRQHINSSLERKLITEDELGEWLDKVDDVETVLVDMIK